MVMEQTPANMLFTAEKLANRRVFRCMCVFTLDAKETRADFGAKNQNQNEYESASHH